MSIRSTLAGLRGLLPLAAICLLSATPLLADTSKDANTPLLADTSKNSDASKAKPQDITQSILDEVTPLNTFDAEGVYVGQSPFKIKRFDGRGAQSQQPYQSISETDASIEYGRRIHLFGNVYLKLAGSYERLDFSETNAPVPTSLQSLGGVVAIENVQQGEVGAFLRVAPGIYYSDIDQVSFGNFNAPVALGAILPVGKKFFVLVGADFNVLAKYPVYPILGVVWLIANNLRVQGTPPDPRLIYSVNEQLDLFVGGEIQGDNYKRGSNPNYRQQDQRFNGAIIDYSEFRVGGGATYSPNKKVDLDIDFAGGWDFGQTFNYYRGDGSKQFETRGAPYARISVTSKF